MPIKGILLTEKLDCGTIGVVKVVYKSTKSQRQYVTEVAEPVTTAYGR